MSVDIGESLMQSWLRHIKRCDIVQTNWKAATHLGINKNKADTLLAMMRLEYPSFCSGQTAGQILKQIEIDALGCIVANRKYFACDIAFHESGLHYSKGTDKVLSKLLRTILCLYSFLEAKSAVIVFATPVLVSKSDKVILQNFIDTLNDCLQNKWGLKDFQVKLYAEYEFETGILNPVMHRVRDIKDNSEVFVRACQLINVVRAAGKGAGTSSKSGSGVSISTTSGTIDVSELSTQDLIEQYVLPKLSQLCKTDLKPYFDKASSSKLFGGGYALLNPSLVTTMVKGKPKDRCYRDSYYLEKTKQNVYVSNDCNPAKVVDWINHNLTD